MVTITIANVCCERTLSDTVEYNSNKTHLIFIEPVSQVLY